MKVTIVDTGDYWTAVYVNGKSVWQDHSLKPYELIEILKEHCGLELEVEWPELSQKQFVHCQDVGRLPDNLDDLEGADW